MVVALASQLDVWAAPDSKVAVIVMQGAGGKAFCAGGDLHGLYRSMVRAHAADPRDNDYARRFFATEYRLNHRIHTYPKPILCWGDGIVMGGGMGLMMGASHRLVSETSRLAMPETGIGLFPDVGATWMLNRLPGRTGVFLALTGASIHAADALYAGLADFRIERADWPALLERLLTLPWANARKADDDLLRRAIAGFAPGDTDTGPLQRHAALIDTLCGHAELEEIVAGLSGLAADEDPWLARAAKNLERASPGSVRLAYSLQQRGKTLSLADIFRLEYAAALGCAAHGDFAEGIRALLIDKDKNPHWQPSALAQADEHWVDDLLRLDAFSASAPHPLADLR
jgi:enoyl-CoA hydratase/carnithine racemase